MQRSATIGQTALRAALLLASVACATAGTQGGGTGQAPAPAPASAESTTPAAAWPVRTREHVDLWLHGVALIQTDTTLVPFFRRGYRDEMVTLKNRSNVTTQLDVNIERLRARLAANPGLINAQFLPLYFSSLDDMRQAIDLFVRANGNPQAASSQQQANVIGLLAGYFPSADDRAWLSLFTSSVLDEDARYYRSYWLQQQRARANVVDSVSAMWSNSVRQRMQRFLNNSRQKTGEILLSLPLDGEGRTLTTGGQTTTAVTFPPRPSDAIESIYVIAHELVGSVANSAVSDNLTPAEKRSGVADRISSAALVRGGLMLLQSVAPELAPGYARYYLRSVNRAAGNDPAATLATVFPLPAAIRDAIARQIALVQGGI